MLWKGCKYWPAAAAAPRRHAGRAGNNLITNRLADNPPPGRNEAEHGDNRETDASSGQYSVKRFF